MTDRLSAADVGHMLDDAEELAFIDVREIMPFGTGHPLLAANLPLSRLEQHVRDLVPRLSTRIVLTDGGEGYAERAAERLQDLGYENVAVLDGGAAAWKAAGEALVTEIEVPTKGFGGFAEHLGHPNFITPTELAEALKSDEDWIVLDSRPRAEYRKGNIPGSIDAPGADVIRWFQDLVPDPKTKVVVNCMSRTRGILGGLSLMAAGVPNEVRVLYNGTRGWLLDGFELERGARRFPPPASAEAVSAAQARVAEIAQRAGLTFIDRKTLDDWRADASRTTYVFDVRTPAEFAEARLPGARNAPEGSIVMSPDHYFATLKARIVLTDDDGVRATITALWLAQMGWGDVAILKDGLDGASPQPDSDDRRAAVPESGAEIAADMLAQRIADDTVRVIDVGESESYENAHVVGASWCSRVTLPTWLADNPDPRETVLTSEDGVRAHLAAGDLKRSGAEPPLVLAGGNAAWNAAGQALVDDAPNFLCPRDDFWLASSERPGDVRQNVIAYLDWEDGLLAEIERGGRVPYRNLIWR